MYSYPRGNPSQINHKGLPREIVVYPLQSRPRKGTFRVVTDAASSLHSCTTDGRTDGDVRRDIAGFPRKTWRLRRETAFATSGGWSHHKEDKTKGHSRAMNHMLLSPDPEP